MTGQAADVFRYQGVDYDLAGISEGTLFDPSQFGMDPSSISTACWRGYVAIFTLADSLLILDSLSVCLLEPGERRVRKEGPPLNGVTPTGREHGLNNIYEGVNLHLDYTGGLLFARDFIEELYVHMGFHPAWKYQHVVELIFDGGVLQKEYDRSERIAQIRQRILESADSDDLEGLTWPGESRNWIACSFDRSYPRSLMQI